MSAITAYAFPGIQVLCKELQGGSGGLLARTSYKKMGRARTRPTPAFTQSLYPTYLTYATYATFVRT